MDITKQLENYKTGFPFLNVVGAATPQKGILITSEAQREEMVSLYDDYKGSIVKFVPASGAASRMFKDLFEAKELLESGGEVLEGSPARKFIDNIKKFPFYTPSLFEGRSDLEILDRVLTTSGLNYGALPKGQLLFHKYSDGARTSFEEHLVEGALYAKKGEGDVVKIHFTVSPDHLEGFVSLLEEVREKYQERFQCEYHITFSTQRSETDIVAVNEDNTPFLKGDGTPLFRPGGHGALLVNLNETEGDIVVLKNIDNVVKEELLDQTIYWKKVLIGLLIDVQKTIFGYIKRLRDGGDEALCDEVAQYLSDTLSIAPPSSYKGMSVDEKVEYLLSKLNRPIRVCGMVKNEGEPGGGPYIVREGDGSTSLQILEGAQLNMEDPSVAEMVKGATHFNPVDLVCGCVDCDGNKFDLTKYIDPLTGFISLKSYQGRVLKAQELPGLWNGSMSKWNTLFVEVPLITFNPVKTVLDLLREEHV